MTAVRSEDGARKVQWVSGSDAGIAHAAISLPCVAEQCEQCARMAEGQGASWPESIPLSGAASECQLTSWLAVKGRGAKKKDAEFAARGATNLLEICVVWHQSRIRNTKFASKFRVSQPVSPRNVK